VSRHTAEPVAGPSQGSISQNNSGGINVQQGTTGSNSPIINSPINIGNAPKAISPAEMKQLVAFLKQAPTKTIVFVGADQYTSDAPFPGEFLKAFHDAGWNTFDSIVGKSGQDTLPYFRGARIYLSRKPSPGQGYRYPDPVAYICIALDSFKVPIQIIDEGEDGFHFATPSDEVISVEFLNGF
jgi:hypothetical protein